jgi:ABC-type branched-subunit amino acid transport system substrate-binding protein
MAAIGPRGSFRFVLGVAVGVLLTGLTVPYVRSQPTTVTAAPPDAAAWAPGALSDPSGGVGSGGAPAGATDGATPGPGVPSGAPDTGDGGAASPAASPATGDEPATATASDVGVTAEEIKVGIALYDIGAASSFGFNFDIGDQRARWQALVDHQNATGGIHGRQIVPVFRTIVAGQDEEGSQAACIAWTRDEEVFSVLEASGITTAGVVCITGTGSTPLVRFLGIDDSYYRSGLLFSLQGSDNRILADHANFLAESGHLDGRTIGVLVNEGAERLAADNTLLPTLERLGYPVRAIEEIPYGAPGTQRSSVAISNFRAAGVDLVIIAAGNITAAPFVQSADRAGYRPMWALSSFNNQINDQLGEYYPDSFDGTIGLTPMRFPEYRGGAPTAPADQRCLDRVAGADAKAAAEGSAAREVAMRECGVFDAWASGATAAGVGLTRASLVNGLETMGRFEMAGSQDGEFGPGRHSAVLFGRQVVYRTSCQCWQVDGGLSAPLRRMD